MAYPRIVRLNLRGVTELPTSFCFCQIKDRQISSRDLLLLVLNKAESGGDGKENIGKPRGFGMPGGGMNPECLDSADGAAKREAESETGLTITKIARSPTLEEYQVIISDKETGQRKRRIAYEKGHEPSIEIDTRHEVALKNPVFTFKGEVSWENSRLREVLLQIKAGWLSANPDKIAEVNEFTDRYGIYFTLDQLSDEEITSLKIDEIEEIEGIGVFPIEMLIEMIESKNPNFEDNYFYFSHLKRIRDCARKLRLIPE